MLKTIIKKQQYNECPVCKLKSKVTIQFFENKKAKNKECSDCKIKFNLL